MASDAFLNSIEVNFKKATRYIQKIDGSEAFSEGKNMFSNLKAAIQKVTSKDKKEDEYQGEDIQAVIVLLLSLIHI